VLRLVVWDLVRTRGAARAGKLNGMAFVAADLGAWLIGVLADGGRMKLATLVLGTDQQPRTLRAGSQPCYGA
jgi:hypothetical protein